MSNKTTEAPIKNRQSFINQCIAFGDVIEKKKPELIALLTDYETHETAHDEISRSIEALRGVEEEFKPITDPLQGITMATFFPLNLPLYSLVLFGIIPSFFTSNIYIRPPEVMHKILHTLWEILGIDKRFPELSLKTTPRHVFLDLYASEADIITFTGKYENALAVHKACPYSLLLYNGSGVNPFLLFENADVKFAAEKAVEMRCFNSGQDCAGPDAFIVPEKLSEEFVSELINQLQGVKVGDTHRKDTAIGPTMKRTYINELRDWLKVNQKNVVYGGKIDDEKSLVYPTIAVRPITEHTDQQFHEFFAPFFYVLTYENEAELEKVINSTGFRDRGMYVSVFGDNEKIEGELTFVKILKNTIVNDVEKGNEEYGGYGAKSNFLLYGDQTIIKPVLISRDMHLMLRD